MSVDVEASGPIPGEFSLLSIGACLVESPETSFYAELKPLSARAIPEAMEVSGLSLESLKKLGLEPRQAMREFRKWIESVAVDRNPVFVGFNAAFDWQFINWYFTKFDGDNPFGHAGLDIKSYYMGRTRANWDETGYSRLSSIYKPAFEQTHNALDDAKAQADLFAKIMAD